MSLSSYVRLFFIVILKNSMSTHLNFEKKQYVKLIGLIHVITFTYILP